MNYMSQIDTNTQNIGFGVFQNKCTNTRDSVTVDYHLREIAFLSTKARRYINIIRHKIIGAYDDKIDVLNIELIATYLEIARLKKESAEQHNQAELGTSPRQLKILILGATQMKTKDILGIAKQFGLSKDNLELQTDYQDNKRFDLKKLKWGCSYTGVLVGPIAHKIVGLGDNKSVLHMLDDEGFPPSCSIRNAAGGLKTTKTSLFAAFERLLNKLGIEEVFESNVTRAAI